MIPTSSTRGEGLRSPPARGLLWAALLISLTLGVGLVVVSGPGSPAQSGRPLDDDEAVAQVVEAARRIVSTARLQQTAGGYSFQSCTSADGAPYQAALYATFAVPQRDSARYLDEVTSAMTTAGWTPSSVVGERFGDKLTRGGVTALINRHATDAGIATMRLYGECRNWGTHRDDNPAWTEVDF